MFAALPQCWPSTASSIEFLVADFCFVFFLFFSYHVFGKKNIAASNTLSFNIKIASTGISF